MIGSFICFVFVGVCLIENGMFLRNVEREGEETTKENILTIWGLDL